MRAAVAMLAMSAVLLVACGEDETPPRSSATATASTPLTTTVPQAATLELQIRHDDGDGHKTSGGLVCRPGEERATGDFAGRSSAELCRDARALASPLTTKPSARRACTQIYGGPQTVEITGTIDGRRVDRRVTRTNGCGIEEYTRLKPILPIG